MSNKYDFLATKTESLLLSLYLPSDWLLRRSKSLIILLRSDFFLPNDSYSLSISKEVRLIKPLKKDFVDFKTITYGVFESESLSYLVFNWIPVPVFLNPAGRPTWGKPDGPPKDNINKNSNTTLLLFHIINYMARKH